MSNIEYLEPGEQKRPFGNIHPEYYEGGVLLPVDETAALARPYLPQGLGKFVAGLEVFCNESRFQEAILHGSLPRAACEHLLAVNTNTDPVVARGATMIPVFMRFSLGERLTNGLTIDQKQENAVGRMLTTGPADWDSKSAIHNPKTVFANASDYMRDRYNTSKKISDGHWIFEKPKDPLVHETAICLPAGDTIATWQCNGEPVATLRAMQIPNNPGMHIIAVTIGTGDIVTYQMHLTPFSPYDLRTGSGNFSWQNDIIGHIKHDQKRVFFDQPNRDAINFSLRFYPLRITDAPFTLQALFRGLRAHLTRSGVVRTFTERRNQDMPFNSNHSVVVDKSLGKETALAGIQKAVDWCLANGVSLPEQLKTEIISECAVCALYTPLSFGAILLETGLWKLFEGCVNLTEEDMQEALQAVFHVISQNSQNTHTSFRIEDLLVSNYHYVEKDYQSMLYQPKSVDGKLSWETVTDGMTAWVKAIEQIRRNKGLNIHGADFSTISRFCNYFGIRNIDGRQVWQSP